MDLPEFDTFLAYLAENAETIYKTPPRMDIIKISQPATQEEISALLQRVQDNAIQSSGFMIRQTLMAYHEWLSSL